MDLITLLLNYFVIMVLIVAILSAAIKIIPEYEERCCFGWAAWSGPGGRA